MARKSYTITMTFTYKRDQDLEGTLEHTVTARTHIERTIKAQREWLGVKGHTEISLLVIDSTGHVLIDTSPRQETDLERGLANADSARAQLRHWDWEGLK